MRHNELERCDAAATATIDVDEQWHRSVAEERRLLAAARRLHHRRVVLPEELIPAAARGLPLIVLARGRGGLTVHACAQNFLPLLVAQRVREGEGSFGYNARTGEYEDLVKAGVIDPTKVTRSALQHAASVSGLLLTTAAMVAEEVEEDEGAGPM